MNSDSFHLTARSDRPSTVSEARPSAMVIAAARVLAKRNAEACGTDARDVWGIYSTEFIADAEAALNAAGAPALLEALKDGVRLQEFYTVASSGTKADAAQQWADKARAAIAASTDTLIPGDMVRHIKRLRASGQGPAA